MQTEDTGRRPYKQRAVVPIEVRFWRYVPEDRTPDGCWEWTGARNEHGYGRLSRGRNTGQVKAHRVSYEIANGPITDGLHVCHRCDNPPCVNPAHLFLGTMADNLRDAAAKGRTGPQTDKTAAKTRKLADAEVVAIRERVAAGEPVSAIAADYDTAPGYVSILAAHGARKAAGGPLTRHFDRNSTAARRARVVEMWADGASLKEIASDIGVTPKSVGQIITKMRAEGIDVPYRRSPR